jgi:hypothetical protein
MFWDMFFFRKCFGICSFSGNVLGYVRMVRSSGLHQCYKSIQFVPDVEDVPTFADKAEEDGLSGQTRDASKYRWGGG